MNNIMEELNLSRKAYINTEMLVKSYLNEKNNLQRKEKEKVTDELAITINGMSMLMSELDRKRTASMLAEYGLIKTLTKSIQRINSNKTLAFS